MLPIFLAIMRSLFVVLKLISLGFACIKLQFRIDSLCLIGKKMEVDVYFLCHMMF